MQFPGIHAAVCQPFQNEPPPYKRDSTRDGQEEFLRQANPFDIRRKPLPPARFIMDMGRGGSSRAPCGKNRM